jgi:hypothetical protein
VSCELASPTTPQAMRQGVEQGPGDGEVEAMPRRRRGILRRLTLAAMLVGAGLPLSCATGSSGSSGSSGGSNRARNEITREELAAIEETEDISAYDAIRRLHPQWLEGRGTVSFRLAVEVQVHFNGARIGSVDELRRIRTAEVQYVEHLEGPQATQRYGTGYERGLILIFGRAGT